jgi:hypothetical protein
MTDNSESKVYVQLDDDGVHVERDGEPDIVVRTIAEFQGVEASLPGQYWISSTIDFPEEFTDDADLIALCRYIRPGGAIGTIEPAPPGIH